MFINGWKFEANNEIEKKAMEAIEASIVESPHQWGPQYFLKDSRLARLALALDCKISKYEDYDIFVNGDFIEIDKKEGDEWRPSEPIIPRNEAVFYAAYILEKNEALKKAFFKKIKRSEKYGPYAEDFDPFKKLKGFKVEKIVDGERKVVIEKV